MRQIIIFDTTLRDGEQSPGASMNFSEKMEVATALDELGIDVIEAGFPIASPGDFEAVAEVAKIVKNASVCGLARCVDKDIDAAVEALKQARKPRIHIFLATSPIHRRYKLKMSEDEVVARAVEGVRRSRNYCDDIEFSCEDACRTEYGFLRRVVEAVIDAGASTVNIPDTVGYTTPPEMFARIDMLKKHVPNIDKAVISVHCHNDLGMATANSLAAVTAGAGQIECTINALGERAGNCSLEEVAMALKVRADVFKTQTNIVTRRLYPMSRLVATVTGLRVPQNKPIVGRNAFAHESGIHQDGVLKEPTTYEIMRPEDIGLPKNNLVLGKHSGRAAIVDRVKTLGFDLTADQVDLLFEEFKKLADRKKEVFDGDLRALLQQRIHEQKTQPQTVARDWTLVDYDLRVRSGKDAQVHITIRRGEEVLTGSNDGGDGPIDSMFTAIRTLTKFDIALKEMDIKSATDGEDALAEVTILLNRGESLYRGIGVSTDTFEATAIAILNAVNRIGDA
ncbi:MAG TPA: 2-isopropylmalate synthase [Planctomycetaceae bacterium]|nr:2-isopropylmalate synthase [Planctomycetaceae bacterium]